MFGEKLQPGHCRGWWHVVLTEVFQIKDKKSPKGFEARLAMRGGGGLERRLRKGLQALVGATELNHRALHSESRRPCSAAGAAEQCHCDMLHIPCLPLLW
jgi:hypothetical protein